ncbi:MAG: LysM peptidoglycan-binding domain-containing protein, partial [Mucilaginibacter polytrichastri]|nr:LysM peptidoglycan-binding domain-containing protein [Mucilaginibacter polytrichastri]
KVVAGQSLRVASAGTSRYSTPQKTSVKSVKASFATYKVKAGDTLSDIAEKFDGATVKEIKTANKLKTSRLQAGMILRIKA